MMIPGLAERERKLTRERERQPLTLSVSSPAVVAVDSGGPLGTRGQVTAHSLSSLSQK